MWTKAKLCGGRDAWQGWFPSHTHPAPFRSTVSKRRNCLEDEMHGEIGSPLKRILLRLRAETTQLSGRRDERKARADEAGSAAEPAPVEHHGARRFPPPPSARRRSRLVLTSRRESSSAVVCLLFLLGSLVFFVFSAAVFRCMPFGLEGLNDAGSDAMGHRRRYTTGHRYSHVPCLSSLLSAMHNASCMLTCIYPYIESYPESSPTAEGGVWGSALLMSMSCACSPEHVRNHGFCGCEGEGRFCYFVRTTFFFFLKEHAQHRWRFITLDFRHAP